MGNNMANCAVTLEAEGKTQLVEERALRNELKNELIRKIEERDLKISQLVEENKVMRDITKNLGEKLEQEATKSLELKKEKLPL